MKNNKLVLVAGLGIVFSSLIYMSNFRAPRELHAGVGGTWSADMKTMPTAVEGSGRAEAIIQLINSGQISELQKRALQAQYLSKLILESSSRQRTINQTAIVEALEHAVDNGVLSASDLAN